MNSRRLRAHMVAEMALHANHHLGRSMTAGDYLAGGTDENHHTAVDH
jgi:hypothetical protein